MLNSELKSCIDKWVAEPIEPLKDQPLSLQQQAVQKYREARSHALTKPQDQLLKKLIYFDSLMLDSENDEIKTKLYELFFSWRGARDLDEEGEVVVKDEKQEKGERLKRAQLKRDNAIQDFQDNGGFSRVLQDIFNPTDIKSLELDSVFQIKKFCREFYDNKCKMSR